MTQTPEPDRRSGYLEIGPLRLYYEMDGSGPVLLLLHGGINTIETSFDNLRRELRGQRTLLAIEQQAHGRTADIDRPLSYEQMVADTFHALKALNLPPVDVFGFSDGGIVALGLAARHPEAVHRVAVSGAGFAADSEKPEIRAMLQGLDPGGADVASLRDAYMRVAPRPEDWPSFVDKIKAMWRDIQGWPEEEMRRLAVPLLVILGDDDFVRPEHALEMYRIIPQARLGVLPATDHAAPITRAPWVAAMLTDFLDTPDKD
jgi:pimeloyl-ACP methyl ester carboxylesterase